MSDRGNNAPFATFSIIFGLLSIPCFGCPIPTPFAIIFGHIALGHIGSSATQDARGRAWVGLFLGYMSLAAFGILAALYAIGVANPSDEVERLEPIAATTPEQEAPPLPPRADRPDRSDDVYLLEGDARYHTFFCSETGDRDSQRARLSDVIRAGFRACDVCQPGSP